jgi:hypothetical protein
MQRGFKTPHFNMPLLWSLLIIDTISLLTCRPCRGLFSIKNFAATTNIVLLWSFTAFFLKITNTALQKEASQYFHPFIQTATIHNSFRFLCSLLLFAMRSVKSSVALRRK